MPKVKSDRDLLNNIFTKIKNVFKTDICIINYRYVVGGPESEASNPGVFLIILEPEQSDIIRKMIPDKEYICITNLINAKKQDDFCIDDNYFKGELHLLDDRVTSLLKYQQNGNFSRLELDDEQLSKLLDEQLTIQFKEQTSDLAEINLNKTMFPMLSHKTFGDLSYYIKRKDEALTTMVTQFITEWFMVVSLFQFIYIDTTIE